MRTKTTISKRIRALINKGYNNKDIIAKLQCKPQAVYNIRYQLNKARGLGSIGSLPNPTDGIGAPPKRKYVRKVKAGELASPPKPYVHVPWQYAPTLQGAEPYMPITMIEKPTLWQRVKGWFRG